MLISISSIPFFCRCYDIDNFLSLNNYVCRSSIHSPHIYLICFCLHEFRPALVRIYILPHRISSIVETSPSVEHFYLRILCKVFIFYYYMFSTDHSFWRRWYYFGQLVHRSWKLALCHIKEKKLDHKVDHLFGIRVELINRKQAIKNNRNEWLS